MGPEDAVRGSKHVDAVRFRFPPPTGLPYNDLELRGFIAALEGIFPVLEHIVLVFERGTEVEWGGCKVGWKETHIFGEGLSARTKTSGT